MHYSQIIAEEYAKVNADGGFALTLNSTKEVDRLGFKYFSLIVAILFFVLRLLFHPHRL